MPIEGDFEVEFRTIGVADDGEYTFAGILGEAHEEGCLCKFCEWWNRLPGITYSLERD